MADFYAILGVPPNATIEQIKDRYRFLALAYHPDKFTNAGHKGQAGEAFKSINEAFETLKDSDLRSAYDRQRAGRSAPPRPSPPPQRAPEPPPSCPRPVVFPKPGVIVVLLLAVIVLISVLSKRQAPPRATAAPSPKTSVPTYEELTDAPKQPRYPLPLQRQSQTPRSTKSQDVTLGMSKADVVAARGKPTVVSEDVWRYGLLEIKFEHDRLISWEARAFPASPPFLEPELPKPAAGEVIVNTTRERVAPLAIRSSNGTSNYLVKVTEANTNLNVLTVFVPSGVTVNVDVPLGRYCLKYAAGAKWYGYHYLFGPTTAYSKASEIFTFTDKGNKVTGYTITLYTVSNGNLQTETIKPEEF